MASEQDLQDALDAIKADVVDVAVKIAAQTAQIADLQAQLAAGSPVTPEQLDALAAEAKSIGDSLVALK